jgi:hypothetical protein
MYDLYDFEVHSGHAVSGLEQLRATSQEGAYRVKTRVQITPETCYFQQPWTTVVVLESEKEPHQGSNTFQSTCFAFRSHSQALILAMAQYGLQGQRLSGHS